MRCSFISVLCPAMPNGLVGLFASIGALKTNFTLVLDVTFREDASRIRKGHSPENFSLMRRMAISLRCSRKPRCHSSLRQKARTGCYRQQLHAQGSLCCATSVAYLASIFLALTLEPRLGFMLMTKTGRLRHGGPRASRKIQHLEVLSRET